MGRGQIKIKEAEDIDHIEIAFDLGARLGFCIRTNNGTFISGCKNLTQKKNDTKYKKLHLMNKMLDDLLHHFDIKAIYYEEVSFGTNTYATQAHGAYKGVINSFAELNGIEIEAFQVPTIKKELTGRGNASKHGMINYAEKYVGYKVTDDNEADAIGVMYCGRRGKR